MEIRWCFGNNKYYRRALYESEKKQIKLLKKTKSFKNEGDIRWLSVYHYEDNEYVVCLDQLGEAYFEGSSDNKRFKKEIRLEKPFHVINFIENYILNDKYYVL